MLLCCWAASVLLGSGRHGGGCGGARSLVACGFGSVCPILTHFQKFLHFQYKVWACCCALPGRLFHLGAGFVGVVWGLLGAWALWSCVCTGTGSSEYCQSLCHVSP